MIQFGKGYFYHEGKVYREVKLSDPKNNRWYLKTKTGKRKWITKTELEKLVKHKAM